MIWIGHSPQGTVQHLARSHERAPVERTGVALCGTSVKLVRPVDEMDRIGPFICYACRVSMREGEWG